MARKIWLVQGESGQYSDWSCWIVRAFSTESAAQKFVELLGEETRLFREKWPEKLYDWGETGQYKDYTDDRLKCTDSENVSNYDGPHYTAFPTQLY